MTRADLEAWARRLEARAEELERLAQAIYLRARSIPDAVSTVDGQAITAHEGRDD